MSSWLLHAQNVERYTAKEVESTTSGNSTARLADKDTRARMTALLHGSLLSLSVQQLQLRLHLSHRRCQNLNTLRLHDCD
jgi:hypothetical protein